MNCQDIIVECDVRGTDASRYRVWVEDELFQERTWRWGDDYYLQEVIAIRAQPGRYQVRIESVPGDSGTVRVENFCVTEGPARVDEQGLVEILSASN
jgi:hypothetical protein